MISKIQIKNFQKHDFLELDFSQEINVLSGQSDMGKSVVYRALEWICGFSNIREEDYRKEGTNETSVKIWLINNFQIERIRTDSINRYILSKEGFVDKNFDNFGRVPPEEIQLALGLKEIEIENEKINLNFANQDQLNFILDSNYSDIFKAKLFNKLTGNEILDVLFKDLNKESLSVNRDIKETEELLIKQEDELVNYSLTYKTLKTKLCMVTEKYEQVKNDIQIYEELNLLADKIKINKDAQEFVQFQISKIKIVSDDKIQQLKQQATQLDNALELINKSVSIHNKLQEIEDQISKIKTVKVNFDDLKTKCNDLKKIQDIAKNISDISTKEQLLNQEMRRITDLISAGEKELKGVWEKCKNICPLCKGEIHG